MENRGDQQQKVLRVKQEQKIKVLTSSSSSFDIMKWRLGKQLQVIPYRTKGLIPLPLIKHK